MYEGTGFVKYLKTLEGNTNIVLVEIFYSGRNNVVIIYGFKDLKKHSANLNEIILPLAQESLNS